MSGMRMYMSEINADEQVSHTSNHVTLFYLTKCAVECSC